jgi:glycerol-3-phosphate dehydrogenase subunit C
MRDKSSPEKKARKVVDECADCDVCRFLMDVDCMVFPELYRLYDKETETGEDISPEELRQLVDLCNFCALCPCPPVRAKIIEAKTGFIDRDGLKFVVRALEDVERLAKICGTFPQLSNMLLGSQTTGRLFKKVAGIHRDRMIPEFPAESFPQWAQKHGLNTRSKRKTIRKVAYFAGCTANYLFPEVPKAVVEVLRSNDVEVYIPEQKCCGMPPLLEGDRQLTLEMAGANIDRLAETVASGYDIVCSCPTCGFMLKHILKEGAYYSAEFQTTVSNDPDQFMMPATTKSRIQGNKPLEFTNKGTYRHLFKDDGYFSGIDPLKRIKVAENTYDLGEYLVNLHQAGGLDTSFHHVSGRMVYYPPCHLREQNIGRPYLELLNLLPGINLEPIDGALDCCGMAGIMGFKQEFHESSVHLGKRLMEKIKAVNPEQIVTDCLSCRLQFNQLLPYKVIHPIELIKEAYPPISTTISK